MTATSLLISLGTLIYWGVYVVALFADTLTQNGLVQIEGEAVCQKTGR